MANQQQKTKATKQTHPDDEIDLLELLHFIVKGTRYWLSGGLIFGLMAVMYALTLTPSVYKQQAINDIGLTQESLSLVRQVMPPMTIPLEGKMKAQGLESLYLKITRGGAAYLDKAIYGVSGLDLKDKTLDRVTKEKIDTVVIKLQGDDHDLAMREIDFIRNNIRGVSQYLAVKKYLDNEITDARFDLFNAEAKVNEQQLSYERASRQLLAYKDLEKKSNEVKDMQIILNLSNTESVDDKKKLEEDIPELTGAKYLPLGNRIIAMESEMADKLESVQISQLQIEALKLSQKVLNDLVVTFKETPYQGDVIDFSKMIQLVQDYRRQKTDYTGEEVATLDNFERRLLSFEKSGFGFSNTLPLVFKKEGGSLFLILASGFMGAFLGFLFYSIRSLFDTYRRRYKN